MNGNPPAGANGRLTLTKESLIPISLALAALTFAVAMTSVWAERGARIEYQERQLEELRSEVRSMHGEIGELAGEKRELVSRVSHLEKQQRTDRKNIEQLQEKVR